MNELFNSLGLQTWKPVLTALAMPPVPFLLFVLVGARLMFRRRLLAWALVLLGCAGIWLGSTQGAGSVLSRWLVQPPRALSASDIADLRRQPKTAIVVLGAGRRLLAPEYGLSTPTPLTAERLRYGIWLSRETQLPLAFSGGLSHGAAAGPTEADVAARVAEREYGRPLRWQEGTSHDTRENAANTVALLLPQGIERIVVVTHALHMPRALRDFDRAVIRAGASARLRVQPAPMAVDASGRLEAGDWLPSGGGHEQVRYALREWLAMVAGA